MVAFNLPRAPWFKPKGEWDMNWHRSMTALVFGCVFVWLTMCAQTRPSGTADVDVAEQPAASPSTMATTAPRTYYVRPDGGALEQCTGLADAPYPGNGANQPCAWDHPFRALPPGDAPRIAGGDTLIIAAGSYRMGYGAPGADMCETDYPWDCHMPPIPGGPTPAQLTRILGAGWDAGCQNPPELWGTERANFILNLTGASNVEITCLEITDHSSCVEDHAAGLGGSALACERETFPYGDWAATGLYAEDAANVTLRHLNIHGLASAGVRAGRLTDWLVENVRLAANGWVGWDGDIDGDDSNAGTLRFHRWTVEWNGCAETYPGGAPTGCWAQTAGGYGDGVGTGYTGGRWIIEDSAFLHNTSDGLDLLYARGTASIEIRRTLVEGNAGNQIKTSGPATIENSIIVGNCGYFNGQPFTYNVDDCRAAGNALSLHLFPGNQITVVNTTLASEGDCLVIAGCDEGCDGSESVLLRNAIFQGHPDFLSTDEQTCLSWTEGFPHDPISIDYALIVGVKEIPDPCPAHSLCDVAPGVMDSGIDTFDAHLRAASPAINNGTPEGAPADDFTGRARDAQPDIGAYEWRALAARVYLPVIVRGDLAIGALQLWAAPAVAGR